MDLRKRWKELCERIGAIGDIDDAFDKILRKYGQPKRYWHTPKIHISKCLKEFDKVRYLATQPDKIELALWLHDINMDSIVLARHEKCDLYADVYMSRNYTENLCDTLDLRVSFKKDLVRLIETTTHTAKPKELNGDDALMADVDLSILGKSEKEYDDYARKIRQEYGKADEKSFCERRAVILEAFLERDPIYATRIFRKKYESRARKNLTREIAALRQKTAAL